MKMENKDYKKLYENALERAKYWAEGKCMEDFYDSPQNVLNFIFPETKEQSDLLFQKMKEAGYEWDAETKKLREIKSDSAWSEEDDEVFKAIYEDLHSYYTLKANMLVYDTYKKEYEKKWENAKKWFEKHVAS